MSDWWSDFITFAPMTTAGDWAWVAAAWLLTFVGLGGYQLWLMRKRRQLEEELSK